MCIYQRYIYNPYSRRKVLVKCGKCSACLQEKACARSNRIRNNVYDDEIALFVTLTYSNSFVPYVRKSDLVDGSFDVPVYRDSSCRLVFSKKKGLFSRVVPSCSILTTVYIPLELRSLSNVNELIPIRNGSSDKVSVCYYSDFQNFLKRLRQILLRNYNYDKKFNYFVCTEYGERFKRSHIHTLLFIPKDDEQLFRCAILKAWPYADSRRAEKYIEVARDAASYVSAYVNGNVSLPSLLQIPEFKPKHHYSKGFGLGLDCFSLPSLLQKIDCRDMHYYRTTKFDGSSVTNYVSIPEYVLNRWFPRHKGFSRLASHELFSLLVNPESACKLNEFVLGNYLYSYRPVETYRIYVSLENAFERFHCITNLNRYDYAIYYLEAWTLSALTAIKDSLQGVEVPEDWNDFYINALDCFYDPSISPTLDPELLQLNPNARKDNLVHTDHFMKLYQLLDKNRKVVNYVMTSNGHNV